MLVNANSEAGVNNSSSRMAQARQRRAADAAPRSLSEKRDASHQSSRCTARIT